MSAVTNGLREGDIGKIMEPRPSSDPQYLFLVLYQFSYYLLVITVLLNVIFGIIIDTFGQLREEQSKIMQQKKNFCFMCGIDKRRFEMEALKHRHAHNGFADHIEKEHNIWDYFL